MADFTGFDTSMDPAAFNMTAAANINDISNMAFQVPLAQDMADVSFTPTLLPNIPQQQRRGHGYGEEY